MGYAASESRERCARIRDAARSSASDNRNTGPELPSTKASTSGTGRQAGAAPRTRYPGAEGRFAAALVVHRTVASEGPALQKGAASFLDSIETVSRISLTSR